MAKKRLNVDLKTPIHYLELRTFELNKILLFWQNKGYIDLPVFKWLKTLSVVNMAKFCRVVNKHYFTAAEVYEITGWKEDRKLIIVDYDVYFDLVQCYMYMDKQRIEVDIVDKKKRKVRLKELVDKYSL